MWPNKRKQNKSAEVAQGDVTSLHFDFIVSNLFSSQIAKNTKFSPFFQGIYPGNKKEKSNLHFVFPQILNPSFVQVAFIKYLKFCF